VRDPCSLSGPLALRDQCVEQSVPFFFKQWGGVHKKKAGRVLDGRVWDEYPARPVPVLIGSGGR
jgi:protein gp37